MILSCILTLEKSDMLVDISITSAEKVEIGEADFKGKSKNLFQQHLPR